MTFVISTPMRDYRNMQRHARFVELACSVGIDCIHAAHGGLSHDQASVPRRGRRETRVRDTQCVMYRAYVAALARDSFRRNTKIEKIC